ncbi:hypothetical protein H9P43_008735 [Blastocladiella emersonii ATCC 22665]|nr:hypothetical protein H9P43_008735 [Blastocladiella emersonii ATCC 22665]
MPQYPLESRARGELDLFVARDDGVPAKVARGSTDSAVQIGAALGSALHGATIVETAVIQPAASAGPCITRLVLDTGRVVVCHAVLLDDGLQADEAVGAFESAHRQLCNTLESGDFDEQLAARCDDQQQRAELAASHRQVKPGDTAGQQHVEPAAVVEQLVATNPTPHVASLIGSTHRGYPEPRSFLIGAKAIGALGVLCSPELYESILGFISVDTQHDALKNLFLQRQSTEGHAAIAVALMDGLSDVADSELVRQVCRNAMYFIALLSFAVDHLAINGTSSGDGRVSFKHIKILARQGVTKLEIMAALARLCAATKAMSEIKTAYLACIDPALHRRLPDWLKPGRPPSNDQGYLQVTRLINGTPLLLLAAKIKGFPLHGRGDFDSLALTPTDFYEINCTPLLFALRDTRLGELARDLTLKVISDSQPWTFSTTFAFLAMAGASTAQLVRRSKNSTTFVLVGADL